MAIEILGSINVDVMLSVADLPGPGETAAAEAVSRLPGGKGANQAVAAKRMGAKVAMIGAVGADADGHWMLGQLAAEGIDLSRVRSLQGKPTGAAYIAVDGSGENQIIVSAGANGAIAPGAVRDRQAAIALAQNEVPIDAIAAFFGAPEAAGRTRILNAAPALPEAATLFARTDILIVNEHELARYCGLRAFGGLQDAKAAEALITRADQSVIVTLGANGCILVESDRFRHVPAFPVTPRDTVGAGDCFVGALAALLDAGGSLEGSLHKANAAAALATLKPGGVPAMPTRAEVEAFLAQGTD